nr:PASTA domain-containing protein [Streptomyces phytophilus]
METVDDKVLRILRLAARVGALEDFAPAVPEPPAAEDGPALAREVAAAGTVLVRDSGELPWSADGLRSLAVIGHLAFQPRTQGGGSATVEPDRAASPLAGLRAALPDTRVDWHLGALAQRGIAPFAGSDLTDPVSGRPGARLVCRGADGTVILDEHRHDANLARLGSARLAGTAAVEVTTVPDMAGLATAAARDRAARDGLEVSEGGSRPCAEEKGTVCATSPPAGEEIDRGDTVALIMSAGSEPVRVPDVTGDPFENALAQLQDAGLEVSQESEESTEQEPGTVLRHDPAGGTEARPGDTVTATVAAEPAGRGDAGTPDAGESDGTGSVSVPDVVSMPFSQARQRLEAAGLEVRRLNADNAASQDTPYGHVFNQSPGGDSTRCRPARRSMCSSRRPGSRSRCGCRMWTASPGTRTRNRRSWTRASTRASSARSPQAKSSSIPRPRPRGPWSRRAASPCLLCQRRVAGEPCSVTRRRGPVPRPHRVKGAAAHLRRRSRLARVFAGGDPRHDDRGPTGFLGAPRDEPAGRNNAGNVRAARLTGNLPRPDPTSAVTHRAGFPEGEPEPGSVLHTALFAVWVRDYLTAYPGGTVAEIGAGLNTPFEHRVPDAVVLAIRRPGTRLPASHTLTALPPELHRALPATHRDMLTALATPLSPRWRNTT